MQGNILINFIFFLKIFYLVIAKKGASNDITCDRVGELEYDCRYTSFQAIKDFKWLTYEDAILCQNKSIALTLSLVYIVFPKKTLTKGWISSPCQIKVLKISRSNLGQIEADAFTADIFNTLDELRLRYADIWLIRPGAFNGLTALTKLTLDSLGLDYVPNNVLASCPKLRYANIYFSFDTKHPIQNKWFSGDKLLYNLEAIDLFGNEIRKGIDHTTFEAAVNVEYLTLRDNYIETIGDNAFKPLKKLKSLDLTFNSLKTLPAELKRLLDSNPSIVYEFGSNPWECTCELELVRQSYAGRQSPAFPVICDVGIPIDKCTDLCSEDSNCYDLQETSENLLPFWHQLSLTADTISVKCNAPKVSIVLKKPSTRILIGQYLDGDYFINLNGFSSKHIVVVFEVGIYATIENSMCITNDRNIQTQFSIRLRSNTSYLFCVVNKGLESMRPLNCNAFHSKHEEINTTNNIWIFEEDRKTIIFLCILSGIISISLGIALAFIAPKLRALFPKNDDYIDNRPPLRRKRRVTKLGSKPKSYHPKLHQINSRSMPMLLSSGVSTPITKSVNRCCNSENCQCYCEILMD